MSSHEKAEFEISLFFLYGAYLKYIMIRRRQMKRLGCQTTHVKWKCLRKKMKKRMIL
jgi:hypothetical protein